MSELFDIPKTPSPRLLWLQKHDIHTFNCKRRDLEDPWTCYSGSIDDAIETGTYATGQTEDDAIVAWAKLHNVKLWNEEGFRE